MDQHIGQVITVHGLQGTIVQRIPAPEYPGQEIPVAYHGGHFSAIVVTESLAAHKTRRMAVEYRTAQGACIYRAY